VAHHGCRAALQGGRSVRGSIRMRLSRFFAHPGSRCDRVSDPGAIKQVQILRWAEAEWITVGYRIPVRESVAVEPPREPDRVRLRELTGPPRSYALPGRKS
jgi:hypothetical protein